MMGLIKRYLMKKKVYSGKSLLNEFLDYINNTNFKKINNQLNIIPPKDISRLFRQYLEKFPNNKEDLLTNYYSQGILALEIKNLEYALEVFKDYIELTKDNKDRFADQKYFYRGVIEYELASLYKNIEQMKNNHPVNNNNNINLLTLALKDFKTSLKLSKDKTFIKKVNDYIQKIEKKSRL